MLLSAKEWQQQWQDRKKFTPKVLDCKQTASRKLIKDISAQEHRMQLRKLRT